MSADTTRILATEEVSEEEAFSLGYCGKTKTVFGSPIGEDGIVSSRIVPYAELDHATLELLYEQSPELVIEKRPEWVQQFHPEYKN